MGRGGLVRRQRDKLDGSATDCVAMCSFATEESTTGDSMEASGIAAGGCVAGGGGKGAAAGEAA